MRARILGWAAAGAAALAVSTGAALAQQPPGARVAELGACANPGRAIGVSRVVEVDTKGAPRFGLQQYKDFDFLKDGEIVLTFDDGPLRHNTQPVLDALAAHCTKATFFMVGQMAVSDPAMVREVARRGHTVGSHTWSHKNLRALAPAKAETELELGVSAVKAALGSDIAPFFRFPYLSDSKAMLQHVVGRDLAVFSIDADSVDYRTRNPEQVHRTIVSQLAYHKKGIVLFHDIQPSTARVLQGLLDDLKVKGFKVVHLVAKSPVKTLPAYDAMAQQELARRTVATASNPMAKKSVVWPVAKGPAAAPAAMPAAVQQSQQPAPPAAAAPTPMPTLGDAWKDRIFQH